MLVESERKGRLLVHDLRSPTAPLCSSQLAVAVSLHLPSPSSPRDCSSSRHCESRATVLQVGSCFAPSWARGLWRMSWRRSSRRSPGLGERRRRRRRRREPRSHPLLSTLHHQHHKSHLQPHMPHPRRLQFLLLSPPSHTHQCLPLPLLSLTQPRLGHRPQQLLLSRSGCRGSTADDASHAWSHSALLSLCLCVLCCSEPVRMWATPSALQQSRSRLSSQPSIPPSSPRSPHLQRNSTQQPRRRQQQQRSALFIPPLHPQR